MVTRWRHLVANTGRGDAWRTLIAATLFLIVSAVAGAAESSPLPILAYGVGVGLPFFVRRPLVDRVELVAPAMRMGALLMTFGALGLGMARGRLWEEGHTLEWPGFLVMVGVVAAYLSAFFWVFSDPEVARLEE